MALFSPLAICHAGGVILAVAGLLYIRLLLALGRSGTRHSTCTLCSSLRQASASTVLVLTGVITRALGTRDGSFEEHPYLKHLLGDIPRGRGRCPHRRPLHRTGSVLGNERDRCLVFRGLRAVGGQRAVADHQSGDTPPHLWWHRVHLLASPRLHPIADEAFANTEHGKPLGKNEQVNSLRRRSGLLRVLLVGAIVGMLTPVRVYPAGFHGVCQIRNELLLNRLCRRLRVVA